MEKVRREGHTYIIIELMAAEIMSRLWVLAAGERPLQMAFFLLFLSVSPA